MRKIFTFFICVFSLSLTAQETSPFAKFGSVSTAHLSTKYYKVDSNASAVVLADIGHTRVEGNSKGWFSLIIKKHRVVHILHRDGFHEADIEIPLYSDGGDAEKMENIRAVTYNLQNSSIRQTWLTKSGIYTEKVNKNLYVKKLVMPNVKPGSIIEYEYEIRSDFISNLDPWYFQGTSPVLWSEFNLSLPRFFSYGIVSYGYHDYYINEKKERAESFLVLKEEEPVGQRFHFSTSVSDYRWVLKNVPGLRTENFTSAIKNHIARLEFQLSAHNAPLAPKTFTKTWPQLAVTLLLSQQFGDPADPLNNWMKPEVDKILQEAGSRMDSAQKIFQYVRDYFNCTDYSALWREQSFRQLWKNKSGSVAEINLLLTALLKHAGMEADPVILSTTDHGYVQEDYPMVSAFNYVICRIVLDENIYYLDASRPLLGFGHLLPECYNGHASILNEKAAAVFLEAVE
ncbi:MAG: transglutaminase domain-containing protein [Chitinophagaceae bacterium]